MTRDEKIRMAGGKLLMAIGLFQGLFWVVLIISPLFWMFGTFWLWVKVFIPSILVISIVAFIYYAIKKEIGEQVDNMEKEINQTKSKLFDN